MGSLGISKPNDVPCHVSLALKLEEYTCVRVSPLVCGQVGGFVCKQGGGRTYMLENRNNHAPT